MGTKEKSKFEKMCTLKTKSNKCIGDFIMGVQECLCMELLKPKGDSTRINQSLIKLNTLIPPIHDAGY
jgi:hypothetical protein